VVARKLAAAASGRLSSETEDAVVTSLRLSCGFGALGSWTRMQPAKASASAAAARRPGRIVDFLMAAALIF
jgi:hypothetical protein